MPAAWRTGVFALHVLHYVPADDEPRPLMGGVVWRAVCGSVAAGESLNPEAWPQIPPHRVCRECDQETQLPSFGI